MHESPVHGSQRSMNDPPLSPLPHRLPSPVTRPRSVAVTSDIATGLMRPKPRREEPSQARAPVIAARPKFDRPAVSLTTTAVQSHASEHIGVLKPRASKRPSKSPLPVDAQPSRLRAISVTQAEEEAIKDETSPTGASVEESAFAMPKVAMRRTSYGTSATSTPINIAGAAAVKSAPVTPQQTLRYVDPMDVNSPSSTGSSSLSVSALASPVAALALASQQPSRLPSTTVTPGESPMTSPRHGSLRSSLITTPSIMGLGTLDPRMSQSQFSMLSTGSATSSLQSSRRASAFSVRAPSTSGPSTPVTPATPTSAATVSSSISQSSASPQSAGQSIAIINPMTGMSNLDPNQPIMIMPIPFVRPAAISSAVSSLNTSTLSWRTRKAELKREREEKQAQKERESARQSRASSASASSSRASISRRAASPSKSRSSPASTRESTAQSSAPAAPSWSVPSRTNWFRLDTVHAIEKKAFPEFFLPQPLPHSHSAPAPSLTSSVAAVTDPGSAPPSRPTRTVRTSIGWTPQHYKDARDWMIHAFRRDPVAYLCFTTVRKYLRADFGTLYKLYRFLEAWDLINYKIDERTRPSMLPIDTRRIKVEVDEQPLLDPVLAAAMTAGRPRSQAITEGPTQVPSQPYSQSAPLTSVAPIGSPSMQPAMHTTLQTHHSAPVTPIRSAPALPPLHPSLASFSSTPPLSMPAAPAAASLTIPIVSVALTPSVPLTAMPTPPPLLSSALGSPHPSVVPLGAPLPSLTSSQSPFQPLQPASPSHPHRALPHPPPHLQPHR